jgi:hypothetical protein
VSFIVPITDRCVVAYETMRQAFDMAKDAYPDKLHELFYTFAGQAVRMCIVGDRLAERFQLPFVHLQTTQPPMPVRLVIELWDQNETGIPCPVRSEGRENGNQEGVTSSHDGRVIGYRFPHSEVLLDRSARRIVGWISSTQHLSLYEQGRPLHVPLTVWHNDNDVPVIHAGLVSKGGKGVVLAGTGGSGKSTSALSCLLGGYTYLSDDRVGLEAVGDGSFNGHSLYASSFVDPDHLQRFPLLRRGAVQGKYPKEDKMLVLLSQFFPSSLGVSCRIRAVALPRVAEGPGSRFFSVSKGDALLGLAPSSLIVGQISSGVRGFGLMARLVDSVPCYRLELGTVVEEIPSRVDEMLSQL